MASPDSVAGLFAQLDASQADAEEAEPDWLAAVSTEEDAQGEASEEQGAPLLRQDSAAESPAPQRPVGRTAMRGRETAAAEIASPAAKSRKKASMRATQAAASSGVPDTHAASSSAAGAQAAAAAPVSTPTKGTKQALPADASCMRLVCAEKLVQQRVLVEVPPAGGQALDLSGDAGAVGRLSANTSGANTGGATLLLDLKGTVYDASLAALPCTACVVHMSSSQAKVEAVFNDFLQLEESALFQQSDAGDLGDAVDWGPDAGDAAGLANAPAKSPKVKKQRMPSMGVSSGKVVKASKSSKKGASGSSKGKRKSKK